MKNTGMLNTLGFAFLAVREQAGTNFNNQVIFRGDLINSSETDLTAIYHFLKPGSLLVMFAQGDEVYLSYKGFRLGYISIAHSPDLQRMLSHPNLYKAVINKIRKNKFLPPDGIEIEIHRGF